MLADDDWLSSSQEVFDSPPLLSSNSEFLRQIPPAETALLPEEMRIQQSFRQRPPRGRRAVRLEPLQRCSAGGPKYLTQRFSIMIHFWSERYEQSSGTGGAESSMKNACSVCRWHVSAASCPSVSHSRIAFLELLGRNRKEISSLTVVPSSSHRRC